MPSRRVAPEPRSDRQTEDGPTGDRPTGERSTQGRPPPPTIEAVLALVERIPPGRVMTYGDVAEYLGGVGPRRIGNILSHHGGGVPWWRVLRADGSCAEPVRDTQIGRLEREGVPLRGTHRDRVDLARARWDGEGV